MKVLQVGIAGAMLVSLAGCGLFAEKHVDYAPGAAQAPSLDIPPDLSKPVDGEIYKVPQLAVAAQTSGVPNVVVADKPVLPVIAGVHMERAGSQRWLVVKDTPENVWRVMEAFWAENGFTLDSEDQAAGIMETGWQEARAQGAQSGQNSQGHQGRGHRRPSEGAASSDDASHAADSGAAFVTGERNQYHARLERGKDTDTVEIYITHRGLMAALDANKVTTWLPRANDPELEAQMLQRLMAHMGGNASAEAVLKPDGEAILQPVANGVGSILIKDEFDKSWRRVGLAIDKLKLVLDDKDRSKGIYYLKPIKSGAKFKLPAEAGDVMANYHVLVQDGGASCTVLVTAGDGSSSAAGQQLLEALYKNIQP